ncbi:MAG: hypothetical protein H6813_01785 [Phycisphaeraceae bacterium]|nr:hypothetical protein [Phycisphaeraceae bacterium]
MTNTRSHRNTGTLLAITIGFSFAAQTALSQPVTESMKFSATDGAIDQEFGNAVAISNGIIAVGARHDAENGSNAGALYLYSAASGAQIMKLLPSDGAAGDEFGFSVAIDGGVVAVGAPQDVHNGTATGSVYVFNASTGAQLAKLTPSDGEAGDLFGYSVAIDAGVIAVGAVGNDDAGNSSGSAYLFDAATGAQLEKLLPDQSAPNHYFGVSIAMDSGVVAVGSRSYFVLNEGFTLSAAFLFDVSSGAQIRALRANNGTWTDFFAESLDIDNGLVAVGAWARSVFFDHSGAMYVFDAATGDQLHYIFPADGHDRDHFGYSISIHNGVIAAGAEQDGDNGWVAGSAYLYDAASGAQIDKYLASDGSQFDYFGTSIAIEDGVVVSGAIGDEDNGSDSGSVYVFGVAAPHCAGDLNADGIVDTADLGRLIAVFGTPDADADMNNDGLVDTADLGAMIAVFSSICP